MLIYIDKEYKCHTSNDGTMREFNVEFFDGKCQTFIEGYRYIPINETGTDIDGMIAPWISYEKLEKAQLEYENEQLKTQNAEYESALTEIETALEIFEQE